LSIDVRHGARRERLLAASQHGDEYDGHMPQSGIRAGYRDASICLAGAPAQEISGRFKASEVLPYIGAQVAGAIVAAAVLYAIASGKPDWVPGGFASNGYGDLSPGKYGMASCFFIQVIACDHRDHFEGSSGWIRRHSNRIMPHSDPSVFDSGHKCFRQSGAQHRARVVR
jgi:hypothetical protein